MPYPNDWEIDIVCSDTDWTQLLIDANLVGRTLTAFTVLPATGPCPTCMKINIPLNHTYIRALGYSKDILPGGARHTMLHELGHVIMGSDEYEAEDWANGWEAQYGLETMKPPPQEGPIVR